MFKKMFLEELSEMRLQGVVELRLQESLSYQKADQKVDQLLNEFMEQASDPSQHDKLDQLMSASNNSAMEYSKVAYMQGFADGLALWLETCHGEQCWKCKNNEMLAFYDTSKNCSRN